MPGTSRKALARPPASAPYPKPGPVGGRLIREVISLLKGQDFALPLSPSIDSHILIAVSGGADSLALAVLLARYGRRVVARRQLRLLHINHGWRGKESDADEAFVRDFAKRLKLKLEVVRLKPPAQGSGESWENVARAQRKEIFAAKAAKHGQALVLTAHQADDLAETVLWRLLTGTTDTHGGGIAVRHGAELRPLLKIRKELLREFLLEEGQPWREDITNRDPRFLRARMRLEMMPVVEALFPRAIEHLVRLAFQAQQSAAGTEGVDAALHYGQAGQDSLAWQDSLGALFGSAGLSPRRAHWDRIRKQLQGKPRTQLDLPSGWKLSREQGDDAGRGEILERWCLVKYKPLE